VSEPGVGPFGNEASESYRHEAGRHRVRSPAGATSSKGSSTATRSLKQAAIRYYLRMNADAELSGFPPEDMPEDDQVAIAADTFRMLAEPTRIKLLWVLLQGERSVGDLAALVRSRPPAVSQHLAKLRLAGVVSTRRSGNRIFYAADSGHLSLLLHEALHHADHVAQGLPPHAADR
jgi:DNA-binding transcriptional ArsR family regulator